MRKEKGITLVALIITIIVMLILVAVSVNVLIKSNLIGTAEKATEKYKTASEEESKGGTITIGDKTYNSIDDYFYGPKLKYKVEGAYINIWLENSIYDFSLDGIESNQWVQLLLDKVLGITMEEANELSEEELKKILLVNVTVQDTDDLKLSYSEEDKIMYSYPITQNGNYTFKATNYKGRTSEITVPVEIDETKIKVFFIKTSDTEVKSFEFYEDQTWKDFIGNNGKIIKETIFTKYRNGPAIYKLPKGTIFYICQTNGDNKSKVFSDDKIIENYTYETVIHVE